MILVNERLATIAKREGVSLEVLLKLIGSQKNYQWAKDLPVQAPELFSSTGVTIKGFALLNEISKEEYDVFNQWWEAYPATDAHAHFPVTRTLRLDYQKCKSLFDNILMRGVSSEDLITALKEDVRSRKINSIQQNSLSYFPISTNYLEKGYWEAAINNANTYDSEPNNNRSRIL